MRETLRFLSLNMASSQGSMLILVGFACLAMDQASGASADSELPARQVKVNRTVPNVKPPKTGLEFSARPTTQEIFRARVFEEPLVPIGGEPSAEESAALTAALLGYAKRSGPDDFASLTGFLEQDPQSPWRAALLTDLGLEYYNTAHYSLALDAWGKAWPLAKDAADGKGKAIADRAAGELAYMYARLGRMTELEVLLKSVENRVFVGAATEKITGTRDGSFASFSYPSNEVTMVLSNSPTSVIVRVTGIAPARPILLMPMLAGSNVLLTWTAVSNTTYRVEFNPDLTNLSNWTAVPGDVIGASNTAGKLDALASSNRFYRVRVLP